MSKRPKTIDEQGHDPKPAKMIRFVECARCTDVRLKDGPWRRPCPPSAQSRDARRYIGE